MGLSKARQGKLNQKGIWSNIFLQYTLLYGVYVAGIFAVLFLTHRDIMQYHDSFTQGVYRLIELRNQFHSILSGDGFSFWSWYEGAGLDEPLENFVDPFSFIGSLFPDRYLELGFSCASLLRMYFGGIAFLILGKENGLKKEQNLIGALLYVFSACFMGLALRQGEQLVNIYLFPLLVASVDKIYKGKKPTLFILTVAYYMIADIYFSYMSAIAIVLYIVIRFYAYNDEFDMKSFARTMLGFIGYGLTGIMISVFTSAFSAFSIMRASTESSTESYGLLFDPDWYMSFGKMLLGTGATYDYMDIGLPILIIMLLPLAVRNCTRRSTNTIMTIILFVMMMIPFFGSMFNGFGYVSFRWSYTFVLFATWSAAEQIDAEKLKTRSGIILPAAGLVLISAWTFALYQTGVISINKTGRVFVPVQLAAGLIIIAIIVIIRKKGELVRLAVAGILAVTLLSLSAGWSVGFINNLDSFTRNAAVYKHLQDSTLRAGNQIEDEGFYRIDSVDGIFRHAKLKYPSNENIWWKTNNLFIYNSRIPETLTEFNVEMGNSYGYARRVYMLSNSNRAGMDFLYGVRYFLGSDAKKDGDEDSDNYAGYGFEKIGEIDGVNVFKNKYDVGLGFVLGKTMLESDFRQLNRLRKEQALLQAAVIPDEQADKCGEITIVGPEDLDFDISEMPYEIVSTDGITFEEGRIIADKAEASFTISLKDIPEGQLMISFDNLLRDSSDGVEGGAYDINAWDSRVTKTVLNQHSRQGISGLKNHDLNMGNVSGTDEITISLSKKGTYTFDRFYVSSMSNANYDKYASECMENALDVSEYDDKHVEATIDTDEEGILFLSIPAYDNWDVYVDGEKAEKINNLDITFMGVRVPAGRHEITLRYNNRFVRYGSIVSLAGVLILALILIRRKKSSREYTDTTI